MKVLIPHNLDLPRILNAFPPSFNYHIDKFYYLVGLITSIPGRNKSLLQKYDYIPINSKILKKTINNYKRYLEYLVKCEILETDGHYIEFEKSKGYRFTESYFAPLIPVDLTQYTLVKNQQGKKAARQKSCSRKYRYLTKWFDDSLNIDTESAYAYIYELFKIESSEDFQKAILKQNAALYNIRTLSTQDYYCSVDDTVGRFHSPLTNIKGVLRNFIKYREESMISIDIKNSQPYFSIILFKESFYNPESTESIIINNNRIQPSNNVKIHEILNIEKVKKGIINKNICKDISSYITWVNTEEMHMSKGFQAYIEDVVNGQFYEKMQEKYFAETGSNIIDRQELKKMVFIILFTDNRFLNQTGEGMYYDKKKKKMVKQTDAIGKRIFKEIYPEVYNIFYKIKMAGKAALPCLLQAIEAYVMIHVIAKRISRERPQMPLFTIHDSIVCPVRDKDYVTSVMIEEMERLIGQPPKLSHDYWSPEKAWLELEEKRATKIGYKAA